MKQFTNIKGIIFDYGGTIDTNGKHWAEVLWSRYKELNIPVSKEDFKKAYVHGERTLALNPMIKPSHDFYDVLLIKAKIQIEYLIEQGLLPISVLTNSYPEEIAKGCYDFAKEVVNNSLFVVKRLAITYKLVLVSNFYGNINKVLENFGLLCSFKSVIESAVVGVRKPDPAIFTLGVHELGIEAHETVVIGDSFSKDIIPAKTAGCHTIWLKGEGWGESTDDSVPDAIITDLTQLIDLL
ncbi:HAD family hydrolase [uncultured Bacteroides sp.]|uniref:HAD family hydrolase n=1 Tax=uncultured Bacteroides sp. TaxID=162156 RepID=UPI002AABFE70|nr:HAD family hydrolase [uncultured Bacteroides sp.]